MFNSDNVVVHRHGTITELFRFECGALVLLGLDNTRTLRFLRVGEFTNHLIIRSMNDHNILMTTCRVRDLEWVMAKDAPVVRVGKRSFAFSMPGMLYGLQFPPNCTVENSMSTLERVFEKFSDYTSLICENTQAIHHCPENDPNFWAVCRPQIDEICRKNLKQFSHFYDWPPYKRRGDSTTAHSFWKAVRTSATTKILAGALLSGFMKPTHISITDCRHLQSDLNKKGDEHEMAYGSAALVNDVVEALEVVWMVAPVENSQSLKVVMVEAQDEDTSPTSPWPFKKWKLNEVGLSVFLHKTPATLTGITDQKSEESVVSSEEVSPK